MENIFNLRAFNTRIWYSSSALNKAHWHLQAEVTEVLGSVSKSEFPCMNSHWNYNRVCRRFADEPEWIFWLKNSLQINYCLFVCFKRLSTSRLLKGQPESLTNILTILYLNAPLYVIGQAQTTIMFPAKYRSNSWHTSLRNSRRNIFQLVKRVFSQLGYDRKVLFSPSPSSVTI